MYVHKCVLCMCVHSCTYISVSVKVSVHVCVCVYIRAETNMKFRVQIV